MELNNCDILLKEIENNVVLVTGATGLIGQAIVKRLVEHNVYVVAVVRDENKAKSIFHNDKRISYITSDINELEIRKIKADYIIHAAAITSSKSFVENPVDVIFTSIEGTRRTLEIARLNDVKGYIYLSSMEVYGAPDNDEKINELHCSNIDTMSVRSSYPESKRMCESLCTSYASQFGVPIKVVRLSQTFGSGVSKNDKRVFAEFARCVIEGRDIILHTKGETKRSYLHVEDAVNAILTVLLKGNTVEAYNATNENTYCSIYELAQIALNFDKNNNSKIIIDVDMNDNFGYSPIMRLNLDSSKLRKLGWEPLYSLDQMFCDLISSMRMEYK